MKLEIRFILDTLVEGIVAAHELIPNNPINYKNVNHYVYLDTILT